MEKSGVASGKLWVMIVDDDERICEALAGLFIRKGWLVSVFMNPEEAAGVLRNAPSRYDAVVADINMPGLNGIEFLKLVRQASQSVPVVMITGQPSIDIAVDAMKMGAVDFLTKPFEFEELAAAVSRSAENAKTAAENALSDEGEPGKPSGHRLEDKVKELSILRVISDTLDHAEEKEAIFNSTMELARAITGGERSLVMLVEPGGKEFVVHSAAGYGDNAPIGRRFSALAEPLKSLIEKRSLLSLNAESGEVARSLSGFARGGGDERALVALAPLIINREVMVVLGVAGRQGRMALTQDASAFLSSLTVKASLKLANIALTESIFTSIIGVIRSLINALDARDTYTKDHSNRVTEYAVTLARAMACSQEVIDSITFAGPLHDIGKIGVRDDILLKRGSLTDEENTLMKSHVIRGEEILRPLNLFDSEKAIVLYHHERWDGDGYPKGFKEQEIPEAARIFSVADTFDAMTTTRPYRDALSAETAKKEIAKCSGTQFDPHVVQALMECELLK